MKTKICIFFIFLFINISGFSQGWIKVWSDEFNTDGLPDSKKWNYETTGCKANPNQELQNYTAKDTNTARVRNGNLIIEARKGTSGSCNYSSARLNTQFKGDWLYGRMEIRAKIPTGIGMWPAIWMMPSDNFYGGWPKSGEIDIMENVGYDPDRIFHTIHATNSNAGANELVNQPYNVFHVYALEWDSVHMDFFVDSVKKFTYNNPNSNSSYWPFDKRFFIILNVAVGGTWGGQGNEIVDNSIFPQRMYIDYVRVYQWQKNPGPYTVTATADTTEGSVVLDPQKTLYPKDTLLKITAIPKKGYRFVNWAVTETGIINTTINPLNITVDKDYHIKANFLPVCEQVLNGDFSSDKNYWSLVTNDGSVATADVLNGELKIQISNKGLYNYSVQILQPNVKIVKGDNYKLSFDAYTSSSRSIDVFAGLNVSPWTNYKIINSVALTSQKQTFSYNFLMAYATDSLARVGFSLAQSLSDVYIDNVSLCDIGNGSDITTLKNKESLFKVFSNETDKILTINYSLPSNEEIDITLYDITGKIIQTIEHGSRTAGDHYLIYNFSAIKNVSGIYIIKLSTNQGNQFQKLFLY